MGHIVRAMQKHGFGHTEIMAMKEVYEPFLIQEGFLQRTPRGREVTHKAYEHLGKQRSQGNSPELF